MGRWTRVGTVGVGVAFVCRYSSQDDVVYLVYQLLWPMGTEMNPKFSHAGRSTTSTKAVEVPCSYAVALVSLHVKHLERATMPMLRAVLHKDKKQNSPSSMTINLVIVMSSAASYSSVNGWKPGPGPSYSAAFQRARPPSAL
jgi:hypothetical protein